MFSVLFYISYDSELWYGIQDGQPDANVLGFFRYGTFELSEHFERIDANLEYVVEKGKQRSERKSHHEQYYKSVLYHFV